MSFNPSGIIKIRRLVKKVEKINLTKLKFELINH